MAHRYGFGTGYQKAWRSSAGRCGDCGCENVVLTAGALLLQLHPPPQDRLTVTAFEVLMDGTYVATRFSARPGPALGHAKSV